MREGFISLWAIGLIFHVERQGTQSNHWVSVEECKLNQRKEYQIIHTRTIVFHVQKIKIILGENKTEGEIAVLRGSIPLQCISCYYLERPCCGSFEWCLFQ